MPGTQAHGHLERGHDHSPNWVLLFLVGLCVEFWIVAATGLSYAL